MTTTNQNPPKAIIRSCYERELNDLPNVKVFIEMHAPYYAIQVIYSGEDPKAHFYDDNGKEKEVINLSNLKTKEIIDLFEKKGFTRSEKPQVENRKKAQKQTNKKVGKQRDEI